MAKLHSFGSGETGNQGVQELWSFHCPGCGYSHGYHVPRWTWNGSLDKPTFTPSLMVNASHSSQCHLNITDGKIIFHGDCRHALAGQTVDIPDWED